MYLFVMKVILESKLGFLLFKKNSVCLLFINSFLFYFILLYILAQAGKSNAVISSFQHTISHYIRQRNKTVSTLRGALLTRLWRCSILIGRSLLEMSAYT